MSDALRGRGLWVPGVPVPQGSMRAVPLKGGRAVVIAGNRDRLASWRADIREAWVRGLPGEPLAGPVGVTLLFRLPRPKSAPKGIVYPAKRPDVDKLARAALDALTGAAFFDDSQVVSLTAAKVFAAALTGPGVDITVFDLTGDAS